MTELQTKLREHAIWAEDWRNFPYEDSLGIITIAVGRNLEDRGLSDDEIEYLLANDLSIAITAAREYPWFDQLDIVRQVVVADMIFNMGKPRFHGFVRTREALSRHDYETAANEMEDSKWFRQTGRRAIANVKAMREGVL